MPSATPDLDPRGPPPNPEDPHTPADADAAIINAGAAVYCNAVYATTLPVGLRLTFAEVNPATPMSPAFRAAIILSPYDAAALADLINRQLAFVEQSIREQQAAAQGTAR